MPERDDWIDAASRVLLGRALLARVVAAAPGTPFVRLKGIALAEIRERLGEPPRWMNDVDLLVPPGAFERAVDQLRRAGLQEVARSRTACTLRDRDTGMDLDLHSELFEPWLFRVRAADVVARARPADRFVWDLDPRDLYVHLVGHFVRSRFDRRATRHLSDLDTVARGHRLVASDVACHLRAAGMGRAAAYVLPLAARRGDRFAADVCVAMGAGLRERAAASVAARLMRGADPRSTRAIAGMHMLNEHGPCGRAIGLASHGIAAAHRRMRIRSAEAGD